MKKIIKNNEELLLKIGKIVVDALDINNDSDLDIIVTDNTLIVKVKNSNISKKREEINKYLMDKYEPVLKKLAKT